jgi:hypothetical protein
MFFDKSWGVQIKQQKTTIYELGNLWGKLAQEIEGFYTNISQNEGITMKLR